MNNLLFCGVLLSTTLYFGSCKEDDPNPVPQPTMTSKVTVQPVYGGQTLYLDSTYATLEGYDVQFTDIKFYFGSPSFDGGSIEMEAGLFDYGLNGDLLFLVQKDLSSTTTLGGYLGVDSVYNHNDPAAFNNGNPLNIAVANDMHWDWNPGYIFVKVEARVDTIPDANPLFDHLVTFHIGKDENIQNLNFSGFNWSVIGNDSELQLKLDMAQFLQNGGSTIDLKTEYTSHTMAGQEALSSKVIVNFRDALSLF
jgi:hypothetical protein